MNRMRYSFPAALLALGLAASIPAGPAFGKGYRVLYSFGDQGGADGANAYAGLIQDADGNLFGTTFNGGGHVCFGNGCGVVFKLAPDGTESVLHAFLGGKDDGANPVAELITDADGNLYGTTSNGGHGCTGSGCGVIFKLTPQGAETVVHFLKGDTSDGANPNGPLVRDAAGNMFGTASHGGEARCGNGGCGMVFKIDTAGVEKKFHGFKGWNEADGAFPAGNLLLDEEGNMFGTTEGGGLFEQAGTAFKITPAGKETVLHYFGDSDDGRAPRGLIWGRNGRMFGTAYNGGGTDCGGEGCGIVYKLDPDGTETVLHRFTGSDGNHPAPNLARDGRGNLYGTTASGGAHNGGVAFKLTPDGTYTVLHDFCSKSHCKDGGGPSGLLMGEGGHLFGATSAGGSNASGVVFRLTR